MTEGCASSLILPRSLVLLLIVADCGFQLSNRVLDLLGGGVELEVLCFTHEFASLLGLLISCKLRNLELRKFQLTGEVFKIIVVIIRHRLRLTETWARWLSTVTKQLTWPRGYFNFVGSRSPKIPRNFSSQALIWVAAAGVFLEATIFL
jgi:hypothetical protein